MGAVVRGQRWRWFAEEYVLFGLVLAVVLMHIYAFLWRFPREREMADPGAVTTPLAISLGTAVVVVVGFVAVRLWRYDESRSRWYFLLGLASVAAALVCALRASFSRGSVQVRGIGDHHPFTVAQTSWWLAAAAFLAVTIVRLVREANGEWEPPSTASATPGNHSSSCLIAPAIVTATALAAMGVVGGGIALWVDNPHHNIAHGPLTTPPVPNNFGSNGSTETIGEGDVVATATGFASFHNGQVVVYQQATAALNQRWAVDIEEITGTKTCADGNLASVASQAILIVQCYARFTAPNLTVAFDAASGEYLWAKQGQFGILESSSADNVVAYVSDHELSGISPRSG